MKKLTRICLCIAIAVAVLTVFWIGFGLGISQPQKVQEKVTVIEPVSKGVAEGEIYTTEIWDNGEVRIVTTQGYINQLSEHTVIVTDRSLDDVQKEIADAMDEVGE